MGGMAMGLLLSLCIANFFMEDSEEGALSETDYKPCCWFWYADD
jgi:hypothetical protein